MDRSSRDTSLSSMAKFASRRDMIANRASSKQNASPRRISDLRKMEFGTDLHSRLSFIKWASRWLYRAGFEKKNKNSLIMDLKDVKVQPIVTEDAETEILKKVAARRASEIANLDQKQWKSVSQEVKKMSHELIHIKGLCDSADADGIIEKFNEIEEQNQARMSLILEQENKIQQLRHSINELQDGVRRMTLTGVICERPSCESMGAPRRSPDNSSEERTAGRRSRISKRKRKSFQLMYENRASVLNTQKNDMRKIYDKVRECLDAVGEVDDCLADRLGPDKEVTQRTVFECFARLNERVDKLLMVKSYFDYRKQMVKYPASGIVVQDNNEDKGTPIINPFIGEKLANHWRKNSTSSTNLLVSQQSKMSVNEKELPYCQLYSDKKTVETLTVNGGVAMTTTGAKSIDGERSSVLAEEPILRKVISGKYGSKSAQLESTLSQSGSSILTDLTGMKHTVRTKGPTPCQKSTKNSALKQQTTPKRVSRPSQK